MRQAHPRSAPLRRRPLAARRWLERIFLLYTPLWTAACALVMWSGAFKRWDDRGHMLFGVFAALPLWLAALACPAERGLPLRARYTVKASVFIALFSFLQNYFGSPLFFRCFGMEYHFHVTWLGNGSPWFLSFLTVAYFSTYFAFMQIGLRHVDAALLPLRGSRLRIALRALCCLALGYSMAFAETLTMANQWLRGYFAYADKTQMLVYGSLCYGTLLSIALPLYAGIGARDDSPEVTPLSTVVWQALGGNMLVLVCYEVFVQVLAHRGP
jgi:cycloeucalenol cycloisomerase